MRGILSVWELTGRILALETPYKRVCCSRIKRRSRNPALGNKSWQLNPVIGGGTESHYRKLVLLATPPAREMTCPIGIRLCLAINWSKAPL